MTLLVTSNVTQKIAIKFYNLLIKIAWFKKSLLGFDNSTECLLLSPTLALINTSNPTQSYRAVLYFRAIIQSIK